MGAYQTADPNLGYTVLSAFSNQKRNCLRGPGFFDSDFSINKNFKLTERMALGVGANFYNVFNHPNFQNPSTIDVEQGRHSERSRRWQFLRPDLTARSSRTCRPAA